MRRNQIASVNPVLVLAFLALLALGAIMVFSASAILAGNRLGDPFFYLKRHLVFLGFGGALMYAASRMNLEIWRKGWFVLYAVTFVLLILTLFLGRSLGGAKRWLYLGPVGFQASELAKFALIVALARYVDRYHSRLTKWRWAVVSPLLLLVPLIGPIVMQPDFGNPFVLFCLFFCILLVAGIPWRHLLIYPVGAIPGFVALIAGSSYRMDRMMGFVNLWRGMTQNQVVPSGAPYQLTQALLALGSGGLLGKGLGESDLKLHYLPQPHTDFIFPVIGEELGFAGSCFVIVLFSLIALGGSRVAYRSERLFHKVLAFGLTFCFVFQAAIHMAVTTALAPTKGITLPFLSYGGSSLVVSCLMAGVLLKLSRVKKI